MGYKGVYKCYPDAPDLSCKSVSVAEIPQVLIFISNPDFSMSADDIAIVGVGCRFPGADDLDEFWRVLVNGENHVKEIPIERWNHAAFYNEDPNEPGKIYTKRAGLLNRYLEHSCFIAFMGLGLALSHSFPRCAFAIYT